VHGRVAYIAALWTSPIAWGRIPIVGNVKLEILSERMINKSTSSSPLHYLSSASVNDPRSEQLIVRWRTLPGKNEAVDKISQALGREKGQKDDGQFTGLFIFEFDEAGRIISHTIENAQDSGNWEKGVGAKVVGLTDWLLRGLKGEGQGGHGQVCPGCVGERDGRT
jgi:hypothetical protein